MTRRLALTLLTAVMLAQTPRLHARQQIELTTMEMLDLYEHRRELALTGLGDRLHVDSVYDDMSRDGRAWIDAKGRQEAPRRALVAATFALEVLDRALPSDTTARLVNWVRQQVLDRQKPTPLELTWHLALVAQLEVNQDTREMTRELEYVRERFPTEPRFDLARGWLEYASYNPGGMLWSSKMVPDHVWDVWEIPFLDHAESLYGKALATPAVAAEAGVRVAELRLKDNRPDDALALLREADQTSSDKDIRYLSALEQGWAYELKQDRLHAIEAFRKALAFLPTAPTASVSLGAQLLLDGQRDEAGAVTDAGLKSDVRDPWRYHRVPDYRLWPEWIAQLREQLK